MKILVVDDDRGLRKSLGLILTDAGYEIRVAEDGEEGLEKALAEKPDLILCDVRMPKKDGLAFLKEYREAGGNALVLVMTAYGSLDLAVEAMKRGAYDYISKPFKPDEILLALRKAQEREGLRRENTRLKEEIGERFSLEGIVARSPSMVKIMESVRKVAGYRSHVLVTGESGTGKEVLARAVHNLSPWKDDPFVAVNCGAIPATLMESEFFGHARGAFTDAVTDKAGLFEEASGGTLFLDEIGDLPLELQVKFLRAIQEGEVRRVGDNTAIEVDVRIIAATAVDLSKAVREGRFREDLFYRLNVVPIQIPPLRQRPEDIYPLAEHLLYRISMRLGGGQRNLSPDGMKALLKYPWPGNVREMENLFERASILADATTLELEDILPLLAEMEVGEETSLSPDELSIKIASRHLEKRLIIKALKKTQYNRSQAARLLEISHRALLYKIKDYEIEVPK